MARKSFSVDIKGYYRDQNKSSMPTHSGVYFVYEAKCYSSNNSVSIKKLIYIGESGNVRDRIVGHEKHKRWKKHVRSGNELVYSTGAVESYYRERVEAAYIFEHKPPENDEYTNSFPFDTTTVSSKGKTQLLNTYFTVYRT